MKTCAFAGPREAFASGSEIEIDRAIDSLLAEDDAFVFLTGGMGDFDGKCSAAVRKAKRRYPDKDIKLTLVEPYMKNEINENKEYYEASFDEVVISMELADAHYKSAITQRNRWMIDRSDYLIAFVYRNFGGAYETLKYAKKKEGIVIINLAEKER
jgi:uncharacterized phage-like protein YoqJ